MLQLLILLASATKVVSQITECDPRAYKELNETHRSTAYEPVYPEHPICDDMLDPGWYRFTSGAGDKMPEHCVDREHCGTVVPLWMDGTHPTLAEGRVYRYVCANLQSGAPGATPCCEQRVKIAVTNCDGYFVYYIQPTPSCPMAYCAGDRAPCPYGKWSQSGFAPCKDAHPDMKNPPTFSGPHVNGKTFHFSCRLDFQDRDDDQRLEVVWVFDGAEDPNLQPVILQDPEREAQLDGAHLTGHLGKTVGCKARAFFDGNKDRAGPWLQSNTYWAGIRVTPNVIEVSEAEWDKDVTVTSTLPVFCNHDQVCCIQIRLDINGPRDDARVQGCVKPLCTSHWNSTRNEASIDIGVIAARDQMPRRDQTQLLLEFDKIPDNNGGPYSQVFLNYRPPTVQVHVTKTDVGHCKVTNDPYITNLSGQQITFQRLGDFTLFGNPRRDFEIQVRTGPCVHSTNRPGTCVCGVAVREKDDVVYAYSCGAVDYLGNWKIRELRLVKPRNISEGTIIKRSTDGQQIVVYLPSSAEVRIQSFTTVINLDLVIPSVDKGHGMGLCGTYDDNPHNDYTRRDGTVDSRSAATRTTHNTPFMLSWANDHTTSLFKGLPDPVKDRRETVYCQCVHNSINCTARGDITGAQLQCGTVCTNVGKAATDINLVPPDLMDVHFENHKRRRAIEEGTLYEDVDDTTPEMRYDPELYQDLLPTATPIWPTPSGINESQADQVCRQKATEADLVTSLQNTNPEGFEQIISSCKSDILYSDSHDFLESMVDAITTTSQVELAKDPSNYVTTPEGENVLKPEVTTDLCNVQCKRNGRCDRGRCICNAGFAGDNCQLIAGIGPQIHNVSGQGLCDINQRPCRTFFMTASNFQMGDSFDCKIQEILPDGSLSTSNVILEPAEFVTTSKLTCPLPDARVKSERSVKRFAIRVTTDGSLYGNEVNVTVYDSVCQNCTQEGCEQKLNTCLINDLCFADSDLNPADPSKQCIVAESTTDWIQIYPSVTASLSGPDQHGDLICMVNTTDTSHTARYKISWYVDGTLTSEPEAELPAGVDQAKYRRALLPDAGQVTCKIRSYYTDRNIVSPYFESNALDLGDSTPYPAITVTLSGPDSTGAMVCTVSTSDTDPNARYKVSWFLDGQIYPRDRELGIPVGRLSAVYNRADLPQSGMLTCKMRSYYADVNVYSPHVTSNAVNLALV